MPQVTLTKITLTLARTKAFPEGSGRHGYVFVAPLDDSGHIDAQAWKGVRQACHVTHLRGDEPVRRGLLVHRAGGNTGATWGFDYDPASQDDDEAGFRFADHVFRVGEYVSVKDADGAMETYRIGALEPL